MDARFHGCCCFLFSSPSFFGQFFPATFFFFLLFFSPPPPVLFGVAYGENGNEGGGGPFCAELSGGGERALLKYAAEMAVVKRVSN